MSNNVGAFLYDVLFTDYNCNLRFYSIFPLCYIIDYLCNYAFYSISCCSKFLHLHNYCDPLMRTVFTDKFDIQLLHPASPSSSTVFRCKNFFT